MRILKYWKIGKKYLWINWFLPKTSLVYIVLYCYIINDTIWQVLSSGGSRCKLSHLHIYENLKNGRKIIGEKNSKQRLKFGPCDSRLTLLLYDDFYGMPTTRNLDLVIVDLAYTPMAISTGCQIVHLDHQNAKVLSSKLNPFGLCEIEWFPWQPIK